MHFISRYNDQPWEWHGNGWTTRETSAEYYMAERGKENNLTTTDHRKGDGCYH